MDVHGGGDRARACGAAIWPWAGTERPTITERDPNVVLACAGDTPTLETVAAAHWLREHVKDLRVRVVNVIDLMSLFPPDVHPHGMREERFVELFTRDRPVVFAFHGYQRAVHQIIHGRPHPARFHVRGFHEQGTTTTPFDMVVLNGMSRYHLAALALEQSPLPRARATELMAQCDRLIPDAVRYTREHLDDPPEIKEWVLGVTARESEVGDRGRLEGRVQSPGPRRIDQQTRPSWSLAAGTTSTAVVARRIIFDATLPSSMRLTARTRGCRGRSDQHGHPWQSEADSAPGPPEMRALDAHAGRDMQLAREVGEFGFAPRDCRRKYLRCAMEILRNGAECSSSPARSHPATSWAAR